MSPETPKTLRAAIMMDRIRAENWRLRASESMPCEFLALYDPAAGRSTEVDSYLRQLDAYIAHFHQSLHAFQQLSDSIQSGTVPGPGEREPRLP